MSDDKPPLNELEQTLAKRNQKAEAQAQKIHDFFLGKTFKFNEFAGHTGMTMQDALQHIQFIQAFGMIEVGHEPLTNEMTYKIRLDKEFRVAYLENVNYNLMATIGENDIVIGIINDRS